MCNPHGCQDGIVFKKLVEYGYRKSTDVAREIFAEIDKTAYGDADFFKMLKKKYESEGADDE
jgi:predicted metalloprotease